MTSFSSCWKLVICTYLLAVEVKSQAQMTNFLAREQRHSLYYQQFILALVVWMWCCWARNFSPARSSYVIFWLARSKHAHGSYPGHSLLPPVRRGKGQFRDWTTLLLARLLALWTDYSLFTSITSNFTVMTSAPCWWYSSPYLWRWRLLAKSHPNRTTTGRTSPACLNSSGQGWTSMLRLTALQWRGLVPKSHNAFDTVDCREATRTTVRFSGLIVRDKMNNNSASVELCVDLAILDVR